MINVRTRFAGCLFKVLTKSDSGEEQGHIGGIYIPVGLRGFFPPLPHASGQAAAEVQLQAVLLLPRGRRVRAAPVYRAQLRGGTRAPETRLTGDLGPVRASSRKDDILLIRPLTGRTAEFEIRIVPATSQVGIALREYAGKRGFGILPPKPDYRQAELETPRTLIARLDRMEAVEGSEYISLEFDGIDATVSPDDLRDLLSYGGATEPFALARVSATRKTVSRRFGPDVSEGAWVELEIRPPRSRGPVAWLAQLGPAGYSTSLKGRLGRVSIIQDAREGPKHWPEAGASVPASRQLASLVVNSCGLPAGAVTPASAVTALLGSLFPRAAALLVRDVGQASFATLVADSGAELIHFDAGWPITFNSRSAPPALPAPDPAPVILSHWDWDHLHAFHAVRALSSCEWIVPHQNVGPGATRVANILHARNRLKVLAPGRVITFGNTVLRSCAGPGGLNHTGLILELELKTGRRALLVGDADYGSGGSGTGAFDLLVATHHGAAFNGVPPPAAVPGSACIVSVGRPNVYCHPCAASLKKHAAAGWSVRFTARRGRVARGDRTLS